MDDNIRSALGDIKTSVRDGFEQVNKRIDSLVTRGEFAATVERLDSQHRSLRSDFDQHEVKAEAMMLETRQNDAVVHKESMAATAALRAEVHATLEGFRTSTRWAVSLAATGAGIIVAGASWLLSI